MTETEGCQNNVEQNIISEGRTSWGQTRKYSEVSIVKLYLCFHSSYFSPNSQRTIWNTHTHTPDSFNQVKYIRPVCGLHYLFCPSLSSLAKHRNVRKCKWLRWNVFFPHHFILLNPRDRKWLKINKWKYLKWSHIWSSSQPNIPFAYFGSSTWTLSMDRTHELILGLSK